MARRKAEAEARPGAKKQRAEAEEDEAEVQLAIDEHGRAMWVGAAGAEPPASPVEYGFRSFEGLLPTSEAVLAALRKDCETAFTARATSAGAAYSRGETFWVPAASKPTSVLEALALRIFELHVKSTIPPLYDVARSGAEWWTLVLGADEDVGWHWDRDYGLEATAGLRLHPHLATVTYLSDGNAPTVILEAVDTPEGPGFGVLTPANVERGYVSFPKISKHVAFDGRWLHAAPGELRRPGQNAEGPRFTFLVNVWLNHQPLSVRAFPDSAQLLQVASELGESLLKAVAPSRGQVQTVELEGAGAKRLVWYFNSEAVDGEDGEEEEDFEEDQEVEEEGEAQGQPEPKGKPGQRKVSLLVPQELASFHCLALGPFSGLAEVTLEK